MKSFAIREGDLVIEGGQYATIAGSKRVFQDLSLAVSEPLGCDRFHPNWGSMLERYVGTVYDEETELLVRAEIFRIIRQYVDTQQEAMVTRSIRHQKSLFASEEIVQEVSGISVTQEFDRINVKVTIQTGDTQPVVLQATVRP